MALEKSVNLPSKFTADYWRVIRYNIDPVTKTVQLQVGLYKNANAFNDGGAPIRELSVDFPAEKFPYLADLAGLEAKAETLLLTEEIFQGAVKK